MKFFNSDKSGFLSFVAKRMKALFALFFIIAGTSSVWGQSFYVAGNGDVSRGNWCDGVDWSPTSSLMTQQGNIYVKQFANLPANDDYQFKIVKDGNWDNGSWGFSNYQSSSDNTNFISGSVSCSDAGGNIKFSLSQPANVTVVFDFTNKHVAVYSSSVEIGLIGSFINNWNLEQQIMGTTGDGVSYTWDLSTSDISLNNSDEFKFISGTSWDNNNNQWGGPLGGVYTIPASASTDGTINFDMIVHHKDCGNVKFDAPLCPVTIQKIELNVLTNDLKITTGKSSTEPDLVTPNADSYVVTWAEPVYDAEEETVVLSATVAAAENAGFTLDQASGLHAQIKVQDGANSGLVPLPNGDGQYEVSHTVTGVQAGSTVNYSLQIVTGGGNPLVGVSDVENLNPQTYTVPEAEPEQEPEPVSLYLIGAGTGAQWNLADALPFTYENGVYTWTGELKVNNEAFKILTSNTGWEPAYVAKTDRFEVVPGEAIDLHYREKSGDNQYTWDDNKFKITEDGEYTIKVTLGGDNSGSMIVTKKSSSCQDLTDRFTISGRFNAGIEDADGLYQGRPISSKEADPANGYWSDGARFIQLTANNVPANYFDWECTTYAIDGVEKTIPDIAWTDKDKTSARAELSLPGTYTFVCKATCNGVEATSESLTITAPAPEMGFNGNIVTNHDWGTPSWAGQIDGGYMQRVEGSLVWKSNGFTVDGFGDNEAYHFVIEQRYKLLGCVTNEGWTEHNECGESGESEKDNKINRSNLSFTNVAFNDNKPGYNFIAINNSGWTAGVNGTKLQLTVTMIGWDSYTVALEEVSQECTTPADNFAISARLNKGAGAPFEGNLVASGSNTATRGYFADDFRTVTLTTTQVADTYEWKLVGYAIDGNPQATADLTTLATITNGDAQTATALLNLPGDYTFQCTAACTDGTPVNSATVTISTYPEIGFDGPIGTPANLTTENNGWNHAWAAEENNGLLERQLGTLTWTNTFTYQNVNNLTDFVVIQRYKLGCVATPKGYEGRPEYLGWAGHDECPGQSIVNSGNKINASANISFQGYAVSSNPGEQNMNFIASGEKVSSWISGETQLTLTVTMTGWDSYTVELAKKQEQIKANYSSNDVTKGTVAMKVGDTPIVNGADITAYIGQIVTLTATPAHGYKVASWEINGKVTESDRTTIKPTLSGDDLNVVVTFERDCYAGVAYDLTGGGVICADRGSTELSLNTLNNVTYQLYKGGEKYGKPVQGNGEAAKWTISEEGTYTAKAYDSRYEECEEQAMDMKGSAVVTSVEAPAISVNPGANVHLTVLQARSFTAGVPADVPLDVPVNVPVYWSITDVTGSGDYCEGDGYMISSQTDTSLVAKFLCIGTAKITATMKFPNDNCKAEVIVTQNGAETEVCASEPEDGQ